MANVYRNPTLGPSASTDGEQGYTRYREADTRVPPKAARVLGEVAVNGVAIEESEILSEAQNHPAENPGQALQEAARALIIRELLQQEAQRLGIEPEPHRDAGGRQETREDALIRMLIEREVDVPSATKQECRRYYDNHRGKFVTDSLYEARHILLAAPESDKKARQEARDRAIVLCTEIAARPEQFSALAREHSDCPSGEQGGNLGQIGPGSTVGEFETALNGMEEGQIAKSPVESRFGFHIIALDRRIEGHQLPFEMVANLISAWLEASAWSKAISQYIAVLVGKANITGIELNGADGPLVQ